MSAENWLGDEAKALLSATKSRDNLLRQPRGSNRGVQVNASIIERTNLWIKYNLKVSPAHEIFKAGAYFHVQSDRCAFKCKCAVTLAAKFALYTHAIVIFVENLALKPEVVMTGSRHTHTHTELWWFALFWAALPSIFAGWLNIGLYLPCSHVWYPVSLFCAK